MSRFKKLKDINIKKDIGELFDIRVTRRYKGLIGEYKNALLIDYNEIEYFFLVADKVETFRAEYANVSKIDVYVKYSVKVQ